MQTRAQAKATGIRRFSDETWDDAYLETKDEQLDAQMVRGMLPSWDVRGEDSEPSSSDEEQELVAANSGDESDSSVQSDDFYAHVAATTRDKDLSRFSSGRSFTANLVWTILTLLLLPIPIYSLFIKQHRSSIQNKYPLNSRSALESMLKGLLNALVLITILLSTLYITCTHPWTQLTYSNLYGKWWEELDIPDFMSCGLSLRSGLEECHDLYPEVTPSCSQSRVQSFVAFIGVLLLFNFHKTIVKATILAAAATSICGIWYTQHLAAKRSAIQVQSIDPTVAYVNESIFIAIDGQNLEDGGNISWVPYWRPIDADPTTDTSPVATQILHDGGVLVSFLEPNEYIPCYSPSRDTSSYCFDDVRLRVHDQRSIVGWSFTAHEHDEM